MSGIFDIIAGWHGFWQFVALWCLMHTAFFVLRVCIRRFTSMVRVCVRGWPPAHLDADGDWKPREETK